MEHIYFDNAATTPMDPKVITKMTDEMTNDFGNASSMHSFGRSAREVVDASRRIISNSINAKENEIILNIIKNIT